MNRLKTWLNSRTGRLITHDAATSIGAAVVAFEASGQQVTWAAATFVGTAAFRNFMRLLLPIPAAGDKAANNIPVVVTSGGTPRLLAPIPLAIKDRLALLPAPSGRKGGALPSPRDDRDHTATLATKLPTSCDNGAGLTFGMLLNNLLGDCYPAALLHALQVLTAGLYTPSNADVLAVYEAMGYDPTKVQPDGSNPTDRGTVGRVLYAWALKVGLITEYAAVTDTRTNVKAAIAANRVVLCEWALPTGLEKDGADWTMPRTGRTAGSWGGHATVEVGFTPDRNRNVTWGVEGTVTGAVEDAYLEAGWTVTAASAEQIIAVMAKLRAA